MTSLQTRLIAFVALMIVLTASISGAVSYFQLRGLLLDSVEREGRGVVSGYSQLVAEWIDARARQTAALRAVALEEEVVPWLQRFQEGGGFDLVYVGYPDRRTLFSSPQNLPAGYDPTQRPWYQGAAAAGERVYVSKPYTDASSGLLVVSLAAAVRQGGSLEAVVAADVSMGNLVTALLGNPVPGEGQAFLLHRDGTILAHRTPALVLQAVGAFSPGLDAARLARLADSGTLTEVSVDGTAHYLLAASVPGTEWLLGIVMKREVVLAPLNTLLLGIALVLAAATAGQRQLA